MFHKGVAVAVLVDGKVARDDNQVVKLPFNTEYALRIKNTRKVAAVVNITIDGEDVLSGKSLKILGDSTLDLERYLSADPLAVNGHRFKFIKMDEQIAAHRGRRADDGVVRVRWKYEREIIATITTYPWTVPYTYTYPSHRWSTIYCRSTNTDHSTFYVADSVKSSGQLSSTSLNTLSTPTASGFTTKGSISNQEFQTVCSGLLEDEEYEISFQIVGETAGAEVTKVVTTKTKVKCEICGTKNVQKNRFCGHCGTNLEQLS